MGEEWPFEMTCSRVVFVADLVSLVVESRVAELSVDGCTADGAIVEEGYK